MKQPFLYINLWDLRQWGDEKDITQQLKVVRMRLLCRERYLYRNLAFSFNLVTSHLIFFKILKTSLKIVISKRELSIITTSNITVDNKISDISLNEIFCHIEIPQRQRIAIAIPAIAAAVFFLTCKREKIKLFSD